MQVVDGVEHVRDRRGALLLIEQRILLGIEGADAEVVVVRADDDVAAIVGPITARKDSGDVDAQTAWDRFDAQQPQCGFGKLGICCRNCFKRTT